MSRRAFVIYLLLATLVMPAAHARHDSTAVGPMAVFDANRGQWDARVHYRAKLQDATLFVEAGALTVAVSEPQQHPAPQPAARPRMHAYTMRFEGSEASPAGEHEQPGYSNYYLGDNPAKWQQNVKSYGSVRYGDLFPGIDLELYAASNAAKYNFIVHPGASPEDISIVYDGTNGMKVNQQGALTIMTSVQEVRELKPYAYQDSPKGGEVEVDCRWRVARTPDDQYRATLEVGRYDTTRDLTIDPTLIFSTYTGSRADNWGTTATFDSHKNTYTAGLVFDVGYPTSPGAYDASYNDGADVGIFKFDTSGTRRLFATYLGGGQADMPHSMYVNSLDQLIIFGTTGSNDFPTTAGAYQRSHAGGSYIFYESSTIPFPNGSDIFVSRFSADGTRLEASTYVGGSGNDGLNYRQYYNNSSSIIMRGNDSLYYNYGDGARGEIVTDNLGNVYIGSTTMSSDFPTTYGTPQPVARGGQDGVVFKLDYNLRNMLWATYLGGTGDDAVYSVDVDEDYNVLACGGTSSSNFPVTGGCYQPTYGGGSADGFVCKIDKDGRSIINSTYVGSDAYDQLYFVRNGSGGDVFLFGQTKATGSTMIYNAGYSVYGSGMLLVRMLPDLSARRWSTVFGTTGRVNLSPTAFTADICNRVYAAGWGRDFVNYNNVQWYTVGTTGMETSADAYSDSTDGQDFYIISIDAGANQLEYATFFGEYHTPTTNQYQGGDHVDGGTSRFDRMATLYQSVCASCSHSQNFPTTPGAWCDSNRSTNCNNALFRFNITEDFPVAEFIQPEAGCAPYTVQVHASGRGSSFHWDFGDGTTATGPNQTHTYTIPGTYTITHIATLPGGCSVADTMRHTVQVLATRQLSHPMQKSCGNTAIQIGLTPTLGATYSWSGGTVSDPSVANPWVTATGVYILTTSAVGCAQTDTFNVTNYKLVDCEAWDLPSCHDSTDGNMFFFHNVGVSTDSLTWNISPDMPSSSNDSCIIFHNIDPNRWYHVEIYGYGCTYTFDGTIPNRPVPYYEKEVSEALCPGDSCSGWVKLLYDFENAGLPQRDTLIGQLCVGQHTTTLTVDGCPLVDTTEIKADHNLDGLYVWADTNHIYLGESVRLHAEAAGDNLTYNWTPGTDIDNPASANPLATPVEPLACYTLHATDGHCSASDSLCIVCTEVVCGPPLFTIPNAFTPNADGVNDAICFSSEGLLEFSIAIFNRWGQRVYESSDPSECWDGTYRGNACLPGVYTYTCHIRCHAGEENDFKGDITLIR